MMAAVPTDVERESVVEGPPESDGRDDDQQKGHRPDPRRAALLVRRRWNRRQRRSVRRFAESKNEGSLNESCK